MFPEFRPGTWSNDRVWYELSKDTQNAQIALLGVFCVAIATFEGFFIPDSISQKNNNPGNLRPVGSSTGFQIFETEEEGWIALKDQILRNINRGLTLREFFLGKDGVYPGYAPLGDNPADVMENYISFVARRLSIPENMDLRTFFPALSDLDGSQVPILGYLMGYKPFDGS